MQPINMTKFLNSEVTVKLKTRETINGKLISVEKSVHDGFGNIILENNGARSIVRGNAVEAITSTKTRSRTEIAEINGRLALIFWGS